MIFIQHNITREKLKIRRLHTIEYQVFLVGIDYDLYISFTRFKYDLNCKRKQIQSIFLSYYCNYICSFSN